MSKQKLAEEGAKRALEAVKKVGFDLTGDKKVYKATVDFLKDPNSNVNEVIGIVMGACLGEVIKAKIDEKRNASGFSETKLRFKNPNKVPVKTYFVRRKKLPNIAVIGDFWGLAVIETLLIMEGYDTEFTDGFVYDWNTDIINDAFRERYPICIKMLVADSTKKAVQYHNHTVIDHTFAPFKASEPEKILQYIHDFNK